MADRELARAGDGTWWINVVDVDRDGPLPARAAGGRLLTVVDGPVLDLDVDGRAHVVEPRRPLAVPDGAPALASVPEGAVRLLDVAFDPAAVRAAVTVLELGRSAALPLADDQAAYVVSGSSDATATGELVRGPAEVAGRCTVAVVTLERLS